MADDTNTNPFLCDDEDFIENSVEEPAESKPNTNESTEPSLDSIAAKLLKDKLFLTALELHTELVETGRELPRLRDYFSNPGNFERTREDSPPSNLARTSSIQTFDSLDFARYSDDGERQVDERVAVLEFELRKAQDTIKSLRASLTKEAETEHVTPEQTDESKTFPDDAIKPLETKALNFLVNQYLLQINSKLTSVTFSEENEEQDFESWDDVGLNIAQPPDLLHLYRDYSSHVTPTSDQCDGGCQTELEIHDITSLEEELESFKIEMEKRVLELEEKLINKDKEMLIRRGVAEGSEADDVPSGCPYENQSRSNQIPFQQYTGNQSTVDTDHHGNRPDDNISDDDSVDDGDDGGSCSDSDLDLEPDCNCDHDKNETCPVCVRVQSPEVYRLDFTGEHSGDQDTLDSGSNNGEARVTVGEEVNNGCETEESSQSDRTYTEVQNSDISDTIDGVNNLHENEIDSQTIHKVDTDINAENFPQGPKIVISDTDADKQKSKEMKTGKTDHVKHSVGEKGSKKVVKKDTKAVRRKEKTPKHSKRKGRISTEGDCKDLKEETKEIVEEKRDDLTQTNRRMSKAFMKALKDVCFYVTKDNRIVSEVSKISDADQQKVVLMLGRCLPHIVPNVLLAKREELIPLILCTAMLHPDAKERDNLLNILFNLIKKPDEEQRQIILTGCVAFAQHVGPRRLEEELLPQCWEQISHKYMERRLLVAEACGGLAAYLPNEIRSSLVLSMLQQMLHDDKEADVREAVVRSLGLLMGFISDPDKYQQGCDLLKTALLDNSERVVTSAQQILLPSFAVWAHELGRLEHSLLHTILRDLEELVKAAIASQKTTTLNEGRFLLYVSTLTELVSFLYVSVIESGPYMDKLDHVMLKTEDLIASRFPTPSSTLTDLSTICGDKLRLAAIVSLFEDHISQEWFEPWDSLNWVVNNLIPRLLEVVMGSALSFPRIVSSLAKCFYKICRIFGKTFVDKKVKPRFIDVLLMGEEHMDPHSNFTSNTTPLTTCVVPVYASGVLSAFNTEEDRMQLSQFLREALFCLSIYQSPKDSLRIAVTELCSSPSNHELLLNVLWEGVVHTSAQVRATAARMFEIVMHGISEVLASTRVIPALVTLGNDPEILMTITLYSDSLQFALSEEETSSVRIATIPALGTIIESISSREMLDRVYMQLQTFLDDPQYREEHSLHVELIATFARVGPNAEPKFRDEFILPRLTTLAIENNNESNESKKKEIALQLFEAYSALSCCFVNYQLVQEVMLPGLRCLKHDMALIAPEHEEVVSSMIKEYESKIETSRPADRSSSVLGSFGTPSSGDDVKARMMNRLKESTAKANISSLFNRKK